MNEVQPIRNKGDITAMKKALHGRDLLLFTLGINTLLRISDLLALKAEDVTGTHLTVREGKTGKLKRIKLNEAARKAVQELAPQSGWLFPSRRGDKPISRVQAYRVLNAAADRAGIKERVGAFGCHSLRKTGAYHAYMNGMDIAMTMRMLNHANERETLRYIGVTADQTDHAYEMLSL